jgi:uncharacterized protein YchJ
MKTQLPIATLVLAVTATLAAGVCSAAPADRRKPVAAAPVIPAYGAEPAPERMEQFVSSADGDLVYRFCVGNECPQPTPKKPLMQRGRAASEIADDAGAHHPMPVMPVMPEFRQLPPATPPVVLAARHADRSEPAAVEAMIASLLDTVLEASDDSQMAAGSVAEFVTSWATLWVEKDTKAFVSLYADTFQPDNGETAKAWLLNRTSKIQREKNLSLEVDELEITENGDQATVQFYQSFNSTQFNARTLKRLELMKIDGKWKIFRETTPS